MLVVVCRYKCHQGGLEETKGPGAQRVLSARRRRFVAQPPTGFGTEEDIAWKEGVHRKNSVMHQGMSWRRKWRTASQVQGYDMRLLRLATGGLHQAPHAPTGASAVGWVDMVVHPGVVHARGWCGAMPATRVPGEWRIHQLSLLLGGSLLQLTLSEGGDWGAPEVGENHAAPVAEDGGAGGDGGGLLECPRPGAQGLATGGGKHDVGAPIARGNGSLLMPAFLGTSPGQAYPNGSRGVVRELRIGVGVWYMSGVSGHEPEGRWGDRTPACPRC